MYLLILIIVLLLCYLNINFTEKLTDTVVSSTFVSTGDAFTGLECIDDSLPLFRYYKNNDGSETMRCLQKPGSTDCHMKTDLFNSGKAPASTRFLVKPNCVCVCEICT